MLKRVAQRQKQSTACRAEGFRATAQKMVCESCGKTLVTHHAAKVASVEDDKA